MDVEGTWYSGEGLKQGDFFSYSMCHVDYKECSNFELKFGERFGCSLPFVLHKARGNGFGFGIVGRNKTDTTRTLSARYYKDGSEVLINQNDMRNDPVREGRPRRLTPQECARLMGFVRKGEQFNIPVSDTRAYKQFGNSVVVPVFKAVATLIEPHLPAIIDAARDG